LRGREPKEISLKNLSRIIHARCTEIINAVFTEIKNYGYDQPSKKLIAGVVITGGGSQLKHIKQLVEYLTGLDTRVGYPNEHLASLEATNPLNSPIYATAVGLLMQGLNSRKGIDFVEVPEEDLVAAEAAVLDPVSEEAAWESPVESESPSVSEATSPAADADLDESAFDHFLDGPQSAQEEDFVEASVEESPEEKQPIATSANQGNWFKKWADKFIDLIDE
jgi:cell division protein FtsA